MPSETEKINVLIVDDEEDIRDVLSISLTDSGFSVQKAEDGKKALEMFEAYHPPIVVTDIKMPGMDGIRLLREIKRIAPETEVLMITGHGDMDLAIQSFKHHAIEFITKPIDVDSLDVAIKRACDKIRIRKKLKDYTENLELMLMEKSRELERSQKELYRKTAGGSEPGETFRDLLDDLPCYLFVADKHLNIVASNKRFRSDFMSGKMGKCYEMCRKETSPCGNCPVRDCFTDGITRQKEISVVTNSGKTENALVWTTAVKNSAGDVTSVIAMLTNINQLLDIRDHLSSLGLMIGEATHGIKGLLTGIDGSMYMLDSGITKNDPEKLKEGMDMMRQMTARLRKTVMDILFFVKDRELKRESIEIKTLAEDLASIIRSKITSDDTAFCTDFTHLSGYMNIDFQFMHEALLNIIENAVDACAEDAAKAFHTVTFTASSDKTGATFIISDDGTGMDSETQKRIFDLFFSAKGKKGTGLGLFISKNIITKHGGTISVSSAIGEGSVFTIFIPVKPPET